MYAMFCRQLGRKHGHICGRPSYVWWKYSSNDCNVHSSTGAHAKTDCLKTNHDFIEAVFGSAIRFAGVSPENPSVYPFRQPKHIDSPKARGLSDVNGIELAV